MVIIASKEGQLANRILHASSFLVNAQEHRYRVLHFFFDDFFEFFSESLEQEKSPLRFFGKRTTRFTRLVQSLLTFFIKGLLKTGLRKLPFIEIIQYGGYEQGATPFDLNDPVFIRKARSKLVLVHGWLFRDPVNQVKHRDLLLKTWTPNAKYRETIRSRYEQYKREHDVLVGIHMRGGDYKKFEGGKWYYSPEVYYRRIKELAALKIFEGKRVAFVICTNEKDVSFPVSGSFSVFQEERHFMEDLYLLALCDYLAGPPSTFSIWASFYGGVPLQMLENAVTEITNENFKPVICS